MLEFLGVGAIFSFFVAVAAIACGLMLGNFGTYLVKSAYEALQYAVQRAWNRYFF